LPEIKSQSFEPKNSRRSPSSLACYPSVFWKSSIYPVLLTSYLFYPVLFTGNLFYPAFFTDYLILLIIPLTPFPFTFNNFVGLPWLRVFPALISQGIMSRSLNFAIV
jgi:hypothetical protein